MDLGRKCSKKNILKIEGPQLFPAAGRDKNIKPIPRYDFFSLPANTF
jgi:hypothetical protein